MPHSARLPAISMAGTDEVVERLLQPSESAAQRVRRLVGLGKQRLTRKSCSAERPARYPGIHQLRRRVAGCQNEPSNRVSTQLIVREVRTNPERILAWRPPTVHRVGVHRARSDRSLRRRRGHRHRTARGQPGAGALPPARPACRDRIAHGDAPDPSHTSRMASASLSGVPARPPRTSRSTTTGRRSSSRDRWFPASTVSSGNVTMTLSI